MNRSYFCEMTEHIASIELGVSDQFFRSINDDRANNKTENSIVL